MFLEIQDLKKSFGQGEAKTEVLKGINFSVEKGEICVLLGPSGSGKSTLLNIIGGIDSADSGYISINGEKTADMNEKALTNYRRRHLGYVFQIEDVNQKYGNTVIMVTHNDAIKNMADRVIKLRDGQIRKDYTNEVKIPAQELDW